MNVGPARDAQPATREIGPEVRILCLHEVGGQLSLDPDDWVPCALDRRPTPEERRAILRNVMSVHAQSVVRSLSMQEPVPEWSRIEPLKEVRPVVFVNGEHRLENGTTLRLSRRYGLEITD